MSWIERFSGAAVTMRVIAAEPLRPCASEIAMGSVLVPGAVVTVTMVEKENVLLPAVTSPLVPSSKKGSVAEPPMALKSPRTIIPVLVGLAPGVTSTVSKVVPPWMTEAGLAAPAPVGLVTPTGVLRGLGAPVTKSALLLSVSWRPLLRRKSAVVLVSVGAAAVPSKQDAPPAPAP